MNYILTEKQFESLSDQNLTIAQHNEIEAQISNRIQYILNKVTSKLSWWDFLTGGDWEDECEGSIEESVGYRDEIRLRGKFSWKPNNILSDDGSIPVRWLWEDFEDEFDKSVEDFERQQKEKSAKAKATRIARKEHLQKMRVIIESKLSKEELKCITFKK